MTTVTFPVGLLVDDAGTVLTAPVVTVTSVVDKAGVAVTSHGATVNSSGSANPISFDYDPDAKGEAWVTLAVSQASHTITGARASLLVYAAKDKSTLASILALFKNTDFTVDPDGLNGTMKVYASDTHSTPNLLLTRNLNRSDITHPFNITG